MVLRRAVGIALTSVALIGAARELQAQPITVTNNGERMAGAQISAMINGIKTPLGTTDSTGQITIDPDDLNITKGTQVTVWIKTCEDGTVQVIMVPEGEQGECAHEGAQAGERCRCKRAGVIIWGNGPVTIDVGRGTVTQVASGGGSYWSKLTLGVGVDARYMSNLEDVAGEAPGATGASATTWAPGIQLLADWRLARWVTLGIDASYATMDADVTFPEGIQTGDLRYYELGTNLKIGPTTGRFRPYVTGGLFATWNKADFDLGGESEYRLHKTRRDGVGAGLDYDLTRNLGIRFEALHNSTFEDHDADEHIRFKGAMLFYPSGREMGGAYAF